MEAIRSRRSASESGTSLKTPWREVIGVVSDERADGLNQKAPTTVLWPVLMDNFQGTKCRFGAASPS